MSLFFSKSLAVARVGWPHRLYPKVNVRFPVEERKQYHRVIKYTL